VKKAWFAKNRVINEAKLHFLKISILASEKKEIKILQKLGELVKAGFQQKFHSHSAVHVIWTRDFVI